MTEESDPKKLEVLVSKAKTLKADYDLRHEYWIKDLADNEGELKSTMMVESYDPAIKFYEILENEFIPLVLKGERDKAKELTKGILRDRYEEHRASIDKVVSMSIDRNKADEAKAGGIIRSRTAALFFFGLIIIAAILILCVFIINQITIPLFKVVAIAEKVAEGDFTAEKVAVTSNDETSFR